jgi:hypothetical protein
MTGMTGTGGLFKRMVFGNFVRRSRGHDYARAEAKHSSGLIWNFSDFAVSYFAKRYHDLAVLGVD